jgi:indolepyruvate ferredoxin oxidoreductase alpha subunit
MLYVVEELEPIFETLHKKLGVKVIGKEKLPTIGELDVSTI